MSISSLAATLNQQTDGALTNKQFRPDGSFVPPGARGLLLESAVTEIVSQKLSNSYVDRRLTAEIVHNLEDFGAAAIGAVILELSLGRPRRRRSPLAFPRHHRAALRNRRE